MLDNAPRKLLEVEGIEMFQNKSQVREKEFTRWLMLFARVNEWLTYHTHDSRFSPAGFPDLVMVRPPEIIFAELKSCLPSARVGSAQKDWLRAIEGCELEARLWTPSDIPQIIERLKRPSSAW